MLSTILLILLILFVIGGIPAWPYNRNWGYGPAGLIATILVIYLILMLLGSVAIGGFLLSNILFIVLILFLIGGIPAWPHSRNWGYGPAGIIGTILVIYLILALLGSFEIGFSH